jgi:hypothetical protein
VAVALHRDPGAAPPAAAAARAAEQARAAERLGPASMAGTAAVRRAVREMDERREALLQI